MIFTLFGSPYNERISEWAQFLNLAKRFWSYLNFCTQKKSCFRQDLSGNLHTWLGTKKKIFWKLLGINTHDFVKNDPNFESKGLFEVKLHGTWHEKFFRSHRFHIWGLELENWFRAIWVQVLSQRTYQAYVQNLSCNFHKQDPIFSRIMGWI